MYKDDSENKELKNIVGLDKMNLFTQFTDFNARVLVMILILVHQIQVLLHNR